jgi:hypothetical protein
MGVGVGLRILRVDGRLDDAVLYCHSETVTIGGTTYRQLKKDTPADGAGETLSISTGALGYYVFGKFVFPLTGVYKILASTIYGVYRAYTNSTRPRVYPCISIYILKSDGTVRTTIATHVSQTSAYLTTSWATYTGASYSFSEYAVVDQTDYLEIDFEGYVGAALTGYYAYLRIDDSTLSTSDQTRTYDWNIAYPTYYTVNVSDSGKGADAVRNAVVKRLADSGKGVDALLKYSRFYRSFVDSGRSVEVFSKRSVFYRSFSDSGRSVDLASKYDFKRLGDSGRVYDYMCKFAIKRIAESSKVNEVVNKLGFKRLTDSGKAVDVLKKVAVKRLAESVRGVEVTWKVGLKVLAEACVARERMYKSIQRILRDVAFGDFGFGYAKGKLVTVSDVARAYDSIVKRSVFYRSLSDSGRSVDVLKKVAVKRLADSGKGADVLTKAVGKRLADSVKGADAVSKVGLKMLMDSFKGTDAMIKGAIKRVVDSSIVGDYMCKNLVKVLHDVNFADFGFAKYYGALRIVSDSVKASDTIAKAGVKNVVEYAKAVELVSKRSVFYRSVVDVGKLVDVIATPKSIVITLRDVAFSDFGILKGIRFTKVDASKVSDTIIKYMVKSATDSSIVYDYMCKILSKKLCDATFADFSISKGITYVRGDAGKASDVISKVMIKNVADSSVMLDALAKSSMFHRSVADAVEGLDYVRTTSAFCRSLRDAVFGDFSSTKVMGKQVYDSSVVSDVILKSVKKVLVEFVIARDAPYRTIILNLRDRFSADFYVGKGYGFSVRDSAVAVDVITKVKYTLFGETVRRVYFHKVWGDIIEPSDYNLRIVVSNAFIQALKNVKDKLGV